jgi:hypothetical protein
MNSKFCTKDLSCILPIIEECGSYKSCYTPCNGVSGRCRYHNIINHYNLEVLDSEIGSFVYKEGFGPKKKEEGIIEPTIDKGIEPTDYSLVIGEEGNLNTLLSTSSIFSSGFTDKLVYAGVKNEEGGSINIPCVKNDGTEGVITGAIGNKVKVKINGNSIWVDKYVFIKNWTL